MFRHILRPLLWLLIASAFVPARAADISRGAEPAWVDPGWRRTLVRYAITFDAQGMSTTVLDFEVLALDQKGAEAISQRVFSYNSYFDELTAGDLATVKADSRVIAADARAVRDEPDSADISSPYFDERRKRIVAFSDVAPGDKVRGRIVYKARRPEFPGEFAGYWHQPLDQPPEVIELTFDGPASKPLQTVARNVEHREERRGDRIVHHVRLRQDSPLPRQTAVGSFDSARRFEFSTFADYAAFAAMLDSRNAPMAVPDEALRKLATEIVGDAATTARKVELLHNWVARNIRYVGIGIEDGGFTSQPAAAVLASRYGDCKAHATLLKALLLAQGIEANFVVVNTAPNYTLTQLATPNFDHAIVYVPELDQYLDPTASTVAFGALPWSLSGKPALNVDKGRLTWIPVTPPERFIVASSTDYVLAPDGTREARSILSGFGLGAALRRHHAQKLERTDRQRSAANMLESAGLRGSGDYEFSDPRALSDEYRITATFALEALDLTQERRLRVPAWTDPRPSIRALSAGGIQDQPFLCRSLEYRETASLSVPEGINFSEKVAPVAYRASFRGATAYGDANGDIEVTGETVLDGRTLRSTARVQFKFDTPVCPAQFVDEIKKGVEAFSEFQAGMIGVTPKRVPYVIETSPAYDRGMKAHANKNYELELTSLKPLAENGHPSAQRFVGWLYEGGHGVAKDRREAARWYRLAAEQGDTFSQSRLGSFYGKGLGVARDDALAAQWYARSAEAGDLDGQMWLATMYRDGRGVARDHRQAEKWLSLAADQGSAWALGNLGLLYTGGRDGIPLDYVKAVDLFRKAADRGDADALSNLGWAYESGLGVAKDHQQAREWYNKAAQEGQAYALQRLDKLSAGGSEWLAALISWWPFFMFVGAWLLLRCLPFRA
jgi:TPR repeat protein/transglutaminase-like putative cysteine protease